MRALFVSEGSLGSGIMGPVAVAEAIRGGLDGRPDVVARFVGLGPQGTAAGLAAREVPGLRGLDLDLQPVRWHAVQAVRARHLVEHALESFAADVLHVNSHSIAMGLGATMGTIPTLLAVDVTVLEWQTMGVWRPFRPYSRALLAPSLARERRALERAASVLAFTEWSAEGVRRAAPGARVEVLHPGLDLERYRPAPRPARDRPRLLFVGGRFAEKGGDDLLRAVGPLLGHELDVDLVTSATVPATHGVTVHRLASGTPELVRLYQEADIFCLPTHADAVPWAVLEAMASGAPVISTAVGAIPELLDHGAAGVIVAPHDVEALAAAVRGLLADRGRRDAVAARARARCEEHFDHRRQADRLVDLARRLSTAPQS